MKIIKHKKIAFLTIVVLILQIVLALESVVYSENDASEQSIDEVENTQLLNQTNAFNFEDQAFHQAQNIEEIQEFSFVAKTFRTTVGQPVILHFTSTLPANEVLVRIPSNSQVVEEKFSNGETIQHSHGEYWVLKTSGQQTLFELPVAVEAAGQYFFTVDHDADHFYLEVEEAVQENKTDQRNDSEEIDMFNETEVVKDQAIAVQPILTKEEHLEISEELIAIEEARILEEITDPQNRSTTTAANWSQFRSAWNNSGRTIIEITSSIRFSSSITGSSLNARSANIEIRPLNSTSTAFISFEASSNILEMNGSANLSIRSMELVGSERIIKHNGSGLVDINGFFSWPTMGRNPVVEAQNINLSGNFRIRSTGSVSPISVVRGGTLTITTTQYGVITSGYSGSNSMRPISSDASSRIILNTNRLSMGTSLERPNSSWDQVNATLSGINGSQVVSSNSNPDDFTVRYTQLFNATWYNSLIFNGSGSEFEPPIQTGTVTAMYVDSNGNELAKSESITGNVGTSYTTQPKDIDGWTLIEAPSNASGNFTQESITVRYVYQPTKWSLSFQASPTLGGSPSSDNETLSEKETTTIRANPNEEYRFVKWEIVSGTNAIIAKETAENTTFTMGNSAASVRAIYEKELTNVNPLDPLDPGTDVDPENPPVLPEDQGVLSIDFASQFNFGSQNISVQDKNYYAQPQRLLNEDGTVNEQEKRPNYVQISDRRSKTDRNGWQLSVTQNNQFSTENGKELSGARMRLTNQQLATAQGGTAPSLQQTEPLELVPGAKRVLLMAQGNEGTGTWIYRFGDANTAGNSVVLDVPKGANPEATSYSSTFTWELSAVPGN